ncbi:hypothetical protein [Terrarubrum flagellatum]|uniref:hypothetical protein n=1 Tax=Terrirubrum flagellatum TaxID=2895980 RepID=UPI0031454C07
MTQSLYASRTTVKNVLFFIGLDCDRRWIARDSRGLLGGVFVDKASALKFAMSECDPHARAVLMVPDHVTLSLTGALPPFGLT